MTPMRNFDYLREIEPLRDLSIYCEAAEAECRSKYDVAALNCRRALEWLVKTLYQLKNIELPERASLYELMTGVPFIEFISDDRMMMAAHYIRKVGNLGEPSFTLVWLSKTGSSTLMAMAPTTPLRMSVRSWFLLKNSLIVRPIASR